MIESDLLKKLAASQTVGREVVVGPGDDCAVVDVSAERLVCSVDVTVDGVHLPAGYFKQHPKTFGYRAATSALSDLAAMGVQPSHLLVSITAPPIAAEQHIFEVNAGVTRAAQRYGANVIGGELSSGSQLTCSITVFGFAGSEQVLFTRSAAKVGQKVCVTGALGASHIGLRLLTTTDLSNRVTGRSDDDELAASHCLDSYLLPVPRFDCVDVLSSFGVQCAIDVSDGLSKDAAAVAEQSGVAFRIDVARLPIFCNRSTVSGHALGTACDKLADSLNVDSLAAAVSGGEDFELLFCCSPEAAQQLQTEGIATEIGDVVATTTQTEAVVFVEGGQVIVLPTGFDHFSSTETSLAITASRRSALKGGSQAVNTNWLKVLVESTDRS